MLNCKYLWFGGLFGIALLLLTSAAFAADAPDGKSVEVLARGPLHEGYAEPVEQQPGAGPVVAKQPPEPIDELPPDQKPAGDHVVWMPGYWAWDADREDYIWVSGFWRATPPAKVWMPGSWRKVDNGYQWVAGFWNVAQQETAQIQYLPQPPAPVDVGPTTERPTPTAIYVPGAWVYRDARYAWRPGYWIEYKPNWIWVPAHYRWTPAGYVFIDGYWDYALADRGMLFAPAYVPSAVYLRSGYYYTPTVVVRDQCVFGALFVRRGHGCYYFGDYFEPRYATVGYVSWCGYSGGSNVVVVRGWYDPMYSYYSVTYRDDPGWRGGAMIELYVGRYKGDVPRPPATLVQQNNIFVNNTVTNNTTIINNKTVNVTNVQMLTTVNAAAKANPNMKMEPVTMAARQAHMQASREIQTSAVQRAQSETKMVAENRGAMPRVGSQPRAASVPVTKTFAKAAAATTANVAKTSGTSPATHTNPMNPTGTGHNPTNPIVNTKGTDPKNPTNPLPKTDPKHPTNPLPKTDPKALPKTDPKHQPTRPVPKKDPKDSK
jgi:hypothetical protein